MSRHGTDGDPALALAQLRARIDELDRRIVELLNERAELAREIGRAKTRLGRRAIRDAEREREILVRVAMANAGPMPQADILAIYRRVFSATRSLEAGDRERDRVRGVLTGAMRDGDGPAGDDGDRAG